MAKRESSPGISPAKKEYGIEAGQILMQNIQMGYGQRPGQAAGVQQGFAVSISASLTAGLTTSVDMGKAKGI